MTQLSALGYAFLVACGIGLIVFAPLWFRDFWGERKRLAAELAYQRGYQYACQRLREGMLRKEVADALEREVLIALNTGTATAFDKGIDTALDEWHAAQRQRTREKVREFADRMHAAHVSAVQRHQLLLRRRGDKHERQTGS
jgi:hypothetical protein